MNMPTNQILSEPESHPYYIAPKIRQQLSKAQKIVLEYNQDRVYIVTGREGHGKSTLAFQLAYAVDNTFNIDNIVFNAEQFTHKIRTLERGQALVYDECFGGLSSKGSLTKQNRELIRLLQECRQRNLFIFLVLPSFFLLDKYPALFRSTALFNVTVSRRNFNHRSFKIYNYREKQELYIRGKVLMDMRRPRIAHSYRFYGKLPPGMNQEEYEKRKLDAFRGRINEESEESRPLRQRNILMQYLNETVGLTQQNISDILFKKGISFDHSSVSLAIKGTDSKKSTF